MMKQTEDKSWFISCDIAQSQRCLYPIIWTWLYGNDEHTKKRKQDESKGKVQTIEENYGIKWKYVWELNRQMGVVDKHDQMPACFSIMRKFLQELQEDILSYDGHYPFIR